MQPPSGAATPGGPARGARPGSSPRPRSRAGALGERQLALVNRIARIATQDLALAPMLTRVVDAVREGCGWEFVAYLSLDLRRRRLVCEAVSTLLDCGVGVGKTVAFGVGVTGEAAQAGRTVLVREVRDHADYVPAIPGVRSEICVPVRHGDELLGLIDIESTQPDAFDGQQELVETIAEQVAGAIAAARMHRDLARRAALLEMMSEISHVALQADQLAEVLARIARFLHQRFDVLHCAILLEGRTRNELVLRAAAGETVRDLAYGEPWPATRGIVGRAWRLAQPQWVPDVRSDADHEPGHPGLAARLVVPIRYRERLLGVIDVHASDADALPLDVRNMVRALADQVAGAIHLALVNQRLLDTIHLFEDKSEQLEVANEKLRIANETLARLSSIDGLTGIANRRQFDASLRAEWRRALRHGHVVALLLIDIDRFKAYNDGYGHLAGDDCLQRVAAELARHVRRADEVVARFGGEEFAVLLPETPLPEALRIGEELRAAVRGLDVPHACAELGRVSISVGVASAVPLGAMPPVQLVDMADKALYAAKSGGRNLVCPYDPRRAATASAPGCAVDGPVEAERNAVADDDAVAPAPELRLDRR